MKFYVSTIFFTSDKENIAHLLHHPLFELIRHDITLPLYVEADWIFNLCFVRHPLSIINMILCKPLKLMFMGLSICSVSPSVWMQKFSRHQLVKSMEIPEEHPQKESYWGKVNPIGLRSCYDEGKRCAETLFFDYHRRHQTKIKVVRIFNTFGPRMQLNDGRVVSNFITQALTNQPITIYGDGSQTRSFCYVTDLIEGLIRMMNSSNEVIGPINLGNPEEITIQQLAEKIIQVAGSSSEIIFQPIPSDDPKQRRPDITLARSQLSWCPSVSLERGLEHTIEYFDKKLRAK